MPNQVTERIYDHIKELPPFSYVNDREMLLRVAGRVEVQYHTAGSEIFAAGTKPRERFFLVKEGAVELYATGSGEEVLVERCGEGDVFGIRPLLAEDNYLFTARAAEDCLLYAINSAGFRELLPLYPKLLQFLATSMAGSSRYALRDLPGTIASNNAATAITTDDLSELQRLEPNREPVICRLTDRIQTAARAMTEHSVGSIVVVNEQLHPIGIITDRDLRRRVATGQVSPGALVGEIMRGPVRCISPDVTITDVQMALVTYGINHIVQTKDGTPNSPVTGVLSRHDLMVKQGNNPSVLVREIQRARSAGYLRTLRNRAETLLAGYLERDVNITFITTVLTRINDAIVRRCIKLGLADMQRNDRGNPPAPFDWLALGSLGRGEQLLRTDQDHALIFADVPEARYAAVKGYFVELAGIVSEHLNTVGFDYCPGDMMASNPRWCLPVSKWREQFSEWMSDSGPESLLNTSIFFDYRGVWGDGSLPNQLTEHIFASLAKRSTRFIATLALAATDNPSPLTFFRNFVVEASGEHKDEFDLKARVMRPLTDAARVLMLSSRQGGVNNTMARFRRLAELEPQNAELYLAAVDAYETVTRLRATIGLRSSNSGRYVNPAELSRLQRLLLRNSFEPVREIQTLLELRFQLNFLR